MQVSMGDLIGLLREEIDQYRRLLLVTRQERVRIVKGELLGIHEMARKKDAVTREMARLATIRRSLLDRLAKDMGQDPEEFTLARLARLVSGEAGDALRPLLEEFRQAVGRLVAANDVNRTLLTRSLENVESSLALFRTLSASTAISGAGERIGEAALRASTITQRA